jgi:hypothetical protein
MPSRSVRIGPCAETFLDAQTGDIRALLLSVCDGLGVDPYVDGETKYIYPAPPVMLRLWRDQAFWAVYSFTETAVSVYNMGREGIDAYHFRC